MKTYPPSLFSSVCDIALALLASAFFLSASEGAASDSHQAT